ncbi:MAG: hypothetical protein ACHQAU_05260 [Gammaproteobacteria bacterium]
MVRFYKQLFYKFYLYNMRSWKDPVPAASQAFAAVCMIIASNVLAILMLSDTIIGTKFIDKIFERDELSYLGVLVVLTTVLWSFFIFRYKHTIQNCEHLNLTPEDKKSWETYLRWYEIGSLALIVVAVVTRPI